MPDPVTYRLDRGVATISRDDGKVNVMTLTMIEGLSAAFVRAETDQAVVVLEGRPSVFSAGYDMAMFDEPIEVIAATLQAGGELVERILSHPYPVVAACTGHAIAQGAFTLLACDVRIGSSGGAKTGLNEVAIGLTIPHYGIEVARHQLAAPWFDLATLTGELLDPERALSAGFFHELAEQTELQGIAQARARALATIDMTAHAATKLRVRRPALEAIRQGLATEFVLDGDTLE